MNIERDLQESIDRYIVQLEEGHRLHRKIKFLLDIRGLLVINKMEGDYVEFGVYRGEMMYAAARILSPNINKYIGLDTFYGLPIPYKDDQETFVYKTEGFMASPREVAQKLMEQFNAIFIEGDFREKTIIEQLKKEISRISVLCIDCNWPSSIKSAVEESMPFMQHGSIIFLDDYFAGTYHRNIHDEILKKEGRKYNLIFLEFMTYPPSARAYRAEKVKNRSSI